ncbi:MULTISPECIES: UDP-3-O-acyl-N-acetylglucosamine deacetylase [Okeania]|uniref:UDP-3-O-acyl-N-acetylglucosamine deacetylase n=1 Tax=Okeania hirsuta TaxID=1458930 RepID=A0A3N6QV28_9CYAN|nr:MULTISPECIES: UDP-3-O-acyl-N-acetylglucosamine deacetylase [Okeania]NES90151.1 UDP-3-O-acyl-N-acetylglucosamine deacetylase [Okeania sp. SIO2B9]NET76777.1 UDP-3-O-acyl-N-acetylglucosamine deacetylase [Okeania sp. SIO1F9]RQH57533.1 UDP-3-O-acyl-N-acetylglucosamine deacetylase [Okeania hirsuta]
MDNQYTLATEFSQWGIGLHSGIKSHIRVIPAPKNAGRYFVRVDLPKTPSIPALINFVVSTTLSTEFGIANIRIRTVEHLLAALAGMGVDNARIEIDGPEVPLLDGSAKLWVEAIASVGLIAQPEEENGEMGRWGDGKMERWGDGEMERWGDGEMGQKNINNTDRPQLINHSLKPKLRTENSIDRPIWINQGDAFVAALPSRETRFTYGIDFNLPAIGNQWHSWSPETESFADCIAPARTFALAHQIEQLREAGLIKGGSLDNALVCNQSGWLNPPLRFENEPVRHKLLDLVGDLSLLSSFPQAHYLAYKASHKLHIQLAQKISELSVDSKTKNSC